MSAVSKACKTMAQKNNMCKAKLDYPCQWLYKVIGTDYKQLHQAIMEIINNGPCDISLSNKSSSGKYLCLNLEITVQNEEERNSIYLNLKSHPHVKIVL
jgi:putative lipoic acid-binding regulatory protein